MYPVRRTVLPVGVPARVLALVLCALPGSLWPGAAGAGGACMVAKDLGQSLGLERLAAPGLTPARALAEAEARLRARGLHQGRTRGLFPQATTDLEHGYLVVVRTEYATRTGRTRVSYGCGFDGGSVTGAEWAALRDLQVYSWGWTPDKGYEVLERLRF
jgi:outer membrane protein TolC